MNNEENKESAEGQTTEAFVFQIIVDNIGDPQIHTNMPVDMAVAYVELAKQKLFAQFYGAVNQIKAEQAARKPDIVKAHIIPPTMKR